MNKTKKIRVAVLYGGRSGEHEVSLISAANVVQNLDRARFEVVPIGIDKQGTWFLGDEVLKELEAYTPRPLKLNRETTRMLFNPESIGKAGLPTHLTLSAGLNRAFDVVFPVLHGPLCEDGTVQGLLELAGLPYVGCGVLSSAIGMDKDISKRLVKAAGITVPPYLTIKRAEWEKNRAGFCDRVVDELVFPVFVKPINTGSSVGISKVKNIETLLTAIDHAFLYDTKIIVEQGIDGIEIEIAVLQSLEDNITPFVSIPGEVRPSDAHGFYSYASKYLDEKGAELVIPAPVDEELQRRLRQAAKEIFLTLECEGMTRVDLFLERRTEAIYFNEINTIPGFTAISMYPKLMAASGTSYSELLTHLVTLAMNKHAQKSNLNREYLALK